MKITTEVIQAVYKVSANVYHNIINKEDAVNQLNNEFSMNSSSAKDYINTFSHMMTGKQYKRTINTEATDYFLDNILKDYGIQKLEIALKSVREHVDYYEKQSKGKLNSITTVVSKYEKIISSHLKD